MTVCGRLLMEAVFKAFAVGWRIMFSSVHKNVDWIFKNRVVFV